MAAIFGAVLRSSAQELLYQEGFNNDGEATVPPRYTLTGKAVYEVDRIQSELANFDQKGPIYWAHNFETTFVGNPAVPARRMTFTWRGTVTDTATATEPLLELFDSSVKWLLNNKTGATVVVHPNAAAIGSLADRLTAAGHTVVDDDLAGVPDEQDIVGDLLIHGPGAANASRFVLSKKPVIVMNNPDYDDMLVGSIGSAATFAPGKVTISTPGHPAAGGKTGSFDAFTGDHPFEIVGSFLPPTATKLATVTRIVPPTIAGLPDVDAVIAGTKQHEKTSGTVTELDFGDSSAGNWGSDNSLPGGYTGVWGIQAKGKLTVGAAGTYRFAIGSDDGARLQIDLNKNGFGTEDTVIEDAGPHAHQIVYADVTFPAAGAYDYDLRSYNSGGGGDLEASVSVAAGAVPDDALDSGYWEVLSTTGTSPVKLQAASAVTAFIATGPNVEVQEPLIVLINGPSDTPPGVFYDGGALAGFEGAGFLGASGLNKWPYPDGQGYRSVRLKPINVTGKQKVRLTVALAATVVDFETSDFIKILVYPRGANSTPVELANFHGVQNAVQPWLADEKEQFNRRLTKQFADFTYDIPAGATDLVVEFQVATTWWTEIAALDNVRITAGDPEPPKPIQIAAAPDSAGLKATWAGGTGPFLVQFKLALGDTWTDLATTADRTITVPLVGGGGFLRVVGSTSKTVKFLKASLDAQQSGPGVTTTAKGAGMVSVDGLNLTYFVSYDGLGSGVTAAHIHTGARGASGAPFVFFTPVEGSRSGTLSGKFTLNDSQKTSIESGGTYFNVHTTVYGGGEIRGQIEP